MSALPLSDADAERLQLIYSVNRVMMRATFNAAELQACLDGKISHTAMIEGDVATSGLVALQRSHAAGELTAALNALDADLAVALRHEAECGVYRGKLVLFVAEVRAVLEQHAVIESLAAFARALDTEHKFAADAGRKQHIRKALNLTEETLLFLRNVGLRELNYTTIFCDMLDAKDAEIMKALEALDNEILTRMFKARKPHIDAFVLSITNNDFDGGCDGYDQ